MGKFYLCFLIRWELELRDTGTYRVEKNWSLRRGQAAELGKRRKSVEEEEKVNRVQENDSGKDIKERGVNDEGKKKREYHHGCCGV